MKSNKDSGPGFATLVPKQKRILLIDDEEDITLSLHLVLEHNGFKTVSSDPLVAYKNFRNGLYDLAILDIKMPEISGFLLYQKIRKKDSRVKICFLTASEYIHEEIRKKYGLDGFKQQSFLKKTD
jgi:DNA-binding response OmpR family regulator